MQEIYDKLTPVRRRQKLARTIRYVGMGLFAGALLAVVLAVASSLLAVDVLQFGGWAALACGPIVGLVMAQVASSDWTTAAQAVDRHFRLDDRTQSAVIFLEQGKLTGLYSLQISDTAMRLADLETASAVRIQPPRPLMIGSGWALVAVAMLLFLPRSADEGATDRQDAPVETERPGDHSTSTAKPLPASVTFGPAINGPSAIAPDDESTITAAIGAHDATTATELLDLRIDAAYRVKAGP